MGTHTHTHTHTHTQCTVAWLGIFHAGQHGGAAHIVILFHVTLLEREYGSAFFNAVYVLHEYS